MVAMNDTYSKETHQIAPKQTIYIYIHTRMHISICACMHVCVRMYKWSQ